MRCAMLILLALGIMSSCTRSAERRAEEYLVNYETFIAQVKEGYVERTPEEWETLDTELAHYDEVQYLEVEAQLSPEQRARAKRLASEYGIYRSAGRILRPLHGFNQMDHAALTSEVDALLQSVDAVSTDAIEEVSEALPKLQDDVAALKSSFEPILRKLDSLATVHSGLGPPLNR